MASIVVHRPTQTTLFDKSNEKQHSLQVHRLQDPETQLSSSLPELQIDKKYLEVSPYTEIDHLLDLESVDIQCQLFAQALTHLQPTNEKYASTRYEDALNWSQVMIQLQQLCESKGIRWNAREFYVVEFRSVLKANVDRELLFQLDKESHREASLSGGLLKYWFGAPDHERRNLATCLWRGKPDAVLGGKGPWHKKARGIISSTYDSINVKGLRMTISDDAMEWRFEPSV